MFTDAFGKIWYKGNLHTQTTNSDGAYTPEETIELYKSKGYDFLALTDHWFHGEGRQEEDFLLLNGTEFDVGSTVQEGIYHIVGIGMEKAPALTKRAPGLSAQKIIDVIGAQVFSVLSMPMVPVGFLTYNFAWIFLALGISIGACGSIISMRKFLDA